MRFHTRTAHAVAVFPLLLALAQATPTSAQQPTPPTSTRFYVTVVRLKPEMLTQWTALQRDEVTPAMKKAGVTSRIVLANAVGNAFEYTIITPFPSFGAMDGDAPLVRALGQEGAAQLNAKLRPCILEQRSFLTNRQEALQVAPDNDALVWRTTIRRATPGKLQEYLAFLAAEVVPAMKRAKADGKIAGYGVATRGVGAAAGELTTITYYSKFADMDAGDPLVLTLGREAANGVNAKGALLSTTVTTVVRRRVAALSY